MSDLVLYGNYLSQPGRSLMSFCKLSGIEFKFHNLNAFNGEHLTEEYSKINPFQSFPAIVHNGFNVWETGAIVVYLADAYSIDNQWYPKDIKLRARIDAYVHWHHQNVREPLLDYIMVKYGPKAHEGGGLTEEIEAPFKAKLNQWYETFTWVLSETHYVARTPTATIADIFAFNELFNAQMINIDLDSHPAIKTWYQEIASIPEVQELCPQAQEIIRGLTNSH